MPRTCLWEGIHFIVLLKSYCVRLSDFRLSSVVKTQVLRVKVWCAVIQCGIPSVFCVESCRRMSDSHFQTGACVACFAQMRFGSIHLGASSSGTFSSWARVDFALHWVVPLNIKSATNWITVATEECSQTNRSSLPDLFFFWFIKFSLSPQDRWQEKLRLGPHPGVYCGAIKVDPQKNWGAHWHDRRGVFKW